MDGNKILFLNFNFLSFKSSSSKISKITSPIMVPIKKNVKKIKIGSKSNGKYRAWNIIPYKNDSFLNDDKNDRINWLTTHILTAIKNLIHIGVFRRGHDNNKEKETVSNTNHDQIH